MQPAMLVNDVVVPGSANTLVAYPTTSELFVVGN